MTERLVALVDDHALLAQTVSHALAEVGITCTPVPLQPADELVAALKACKPDLVLLDLDLGGFGDATALIAPLASAGIRVLIVTGQTDRLWLARALEQGAIGIQSKAAGFDELVGAVQEAAMTTAIRRDPVAATLLAELHAHRARSAAERRPFEALTDRERQALVELARGSTVAQIAKRWVVSSATVRSHVQSILRKLGAGSQLQAVVLAVHAGFIDVEVASERSAVTR